MPHKYLNKIGINSDDVCIFNTENINIDRCRRERFQKQRKKYGFDERETWALDYTLATWLYSHLKMYKKCASRVVDLSYHKFDIPDWNEPEKVIEVNQKEAIDIAIKKLKNYLVDEEGSEIKDFQYALRIIGIIGPALWW